MAEFEEQDLSADGWFSPLQIEIKSQVFCGAASYLTRTDKVR